ncbi:hypothetical protein [Lyngbya sp. CCY1209]|nr:hypothetical protein [Lyngbya sp. CCY1209]
MLKLPQCPGGEPVLRVGGSDGKTGGDRTEILRDGVAVEMKEI